MVAVLKLNVLKPKVSHIIAHLIICHIILFFVALLAVWCVFVGCCLLVGSVFVIWYYANKWKQRSPHWWHTAKALYPYTWTSFAIGKIHTCIIAFNLVIGRALLCGQLPLLITFVSVLPREPFQHLFYMKRASISIKQILNQSKQCYTNVWFYYLLNFCEALIYRRLIRHWLIFVVLASIAVEWVTVVHCKSTCPICHCQCEC